MESEARKPDDKRGGPNWHVWVSTIAGLIAIFGALSTCTNLFDRGPKIVEIKSDEYGCSTSITNRLTGERDSCNTVGFLRPEEGFVLLTNSVLPYEIEHEGSGSGCAEPTFVYETREGGTQVAVRAEARANARSFSGHGASSGKVNCRLIGNAIEETHE